MTTRPWVLAESTWPTVRDARYEVVVLPWGATEAHNTHLPYATDVVEASEVAIAAAGIAWDRGARVVVLPAIPFGVNTGQLAVPYCVNLNPSTQLVVLRDVLRAIEPHGARKLVVVNGHGGNDFKPILRELQPHTPLFLSYVNWWTVLDAGRYFREPGDHAGALETSVMMHLAPTQVRGLDEAGAGEARRFRIAALREGWAWAQRDWPSVTSDTGVGNPAESTAATGERFVKDAAERLAGYFVELAAADLDALYE
ncbi:MAG: creatininase family protein [Gemmatimonadetes bacterium]|nr:creatininase family protein [Gemmatimonadota bacterium]MCC6771346.1 creatininase family protein [Gemmatimonadaceae bacterium]